MTRRTAALVPQEKMDWKADVPAALGQARREGKLLLLQFTVPGRPACQAMEEETLGAPEVVRRCREKFVSARIDVERHPDLFQKTVRQEVLNLSNRRQEVGCYIPPAVSPASLFARP